jgi:hypothetical protein
MHPPAPRRLAALVAAAMAAFAACDSPSGAGDPDVRTVTVTPALDSLFPGETVTLAATVDGAPGVAWRTRDGGVAGVSAGGVVTAVAPGATWVLARATADTTVADSARIVVVADQRPLAVTGTARISSAVWATLRGAAAGNGLPATRWFEWGASPTLDGAASTTPVAVDAGTVPVAVSADLVTLTLGSTYYYRMVASNALGTTRGAIVAFTMAQPGATPGLTATYRPATRTVDLAWQAPAGAHEYQVERRMSPTAAWTRLHPGEVEPTLFTDTTVAVDSTRTVAYRVLSCNNVGCGPPPPEVTATVQRLEPPTGLAAEAVSATSVRLSWSRGGDEQGWVVERRVPGGAWTGLTSVGATTYTNTGLTTGLTYEYRVRAFTTYRRRSEPTPAVSVTPGGAGPGTAPAAVTGTARISSWEWATLRGSAAGNGLAATAWFEWSASPTLAGATATAAVEANPGTALAAYSAEVVGLTPGATYYYRSVARNAAGTTTGAIVSFTMAAPGATTGFTANLQRATYTVALSWTPAAGSHLYQVERRMPGGAWTPLHAGTLTTTSTTDTTVAVDSTRTVSYRVQSCNNAGCGPFTEASVTVQHLLPPTGFTAVRASATSAQLSWTPGGDEQGWVVERRVGDGGWASLTSLGTTSYTAAGLTTGVTYHFRVRALTTYRRRSVPTAEQSVTP